MQPLGNFTRSDKTNRSCYENGSDQRKQSVIRKIPIIFCPICSEAKPGQNDDRDFPVWLLQLISSLQQEDIMLHALIAHFLGPDRSLNFSDMSSSKEHHAKTGLSDTATDGVGKFFA